MSQVRKFLQNGGNTPRTYNLILDGQSFTINDDQLTEINNEIAALDPRHRAYLGGVAGTIASGVFVGNRAKNEISAPALSNLNDKEMDFLKAGKQTVWEAITDSNTYRAKEAINEALNIVARVVHKKSETKSEASSKNIAHNRKANFDYDTIDGKQVFSTNPINGLITDRFKSYLDWLSDEKWGDANQWEEALGDNEAVLRSWYNNLGSRELAQAAIDKAMDEVRSKPWNEVSEATKELLKYFNIGNGESTSAVVPKSDIQNQIETDFKDNPGLYDFIGDAFVKDKYGIWRLKPGMEFNIGIPELNGRNIYFNDDFYEQYGADPRFAPLKGLSFINGALYPKDSKHLAAYLNEPGGFNELVAKGDFQRADEKVLTRFTALNKENPQRLGQDKYSAYMEAHPSYLFTNITGLADPTVSGLLGNDGYLLQYIDLDSPEFDGPYKTYKYKYVGLDKDGLNGVDIPGINKRTNGQLKPFGGYYDRISGTGTDYDGRYYIDFTGRNKRTKKDEIGYRLIVDPNDASSYLLHVPKVYATGVQKEDYIKIPKELGDLLIKYKNDWANMVVGNAKNQKIFNHIISKLVQSRSAQAGFSWSDIYSFRELFSKDIKDLKQFFPSANVAELQKVVNALHESYKNNKAERTLDYLETPPSSQITMEKHGGKMEYVAKLATGGISGGSLETKGPYRVKSKRPIQNPRNAAPITHIGQEDWTNADTADLIALIGDLGSLAAAIIPGANTASAAIGAGSSLTRYGADLSRDHNWLAATTGLLLNLTMDAATLIPFSSGIAKSYKIVRSVKEALPTIIKMASVYGLGSAVVESARRIANGEEWTTRDVSNLVNGLTAVTGIYKQGLGKGKKTVTTDKMSVPTRTTDKVDLKGKSIELSSAEVDGIAKLDKSKQADAMDNLLWEKVKKMSGKSNLSKEDALAAVDRSQFDFDHRNWNPFRKGFLRNTTDFELGNTSTTKYNKSTKRGEYNDAMIYGNQKASTLPPRIPNKSDVRVSTGKATGPDGFIYNINEAPTGSTPIYRTYQGRVVKPSDQQLVPVTNPTIQATRYSIATPQLFGPQYFKNDYEHEPLEELKNGGIIKAQQGTIVATVTRRGTNGNQKTETYEFPEGTSEDIINQTIYGTAGLHLNVAGVEGNSAYDPNEIVNISFSKNTNQVNEEPKLETKEETPQVKTNPVLVGVKPLPSSLRPNVSSYDFINYNVSPTEQSKVIPNVPLAKQKLIKIKTRTPKDMNDLVNVLQELVNNKSNSVVKGQNGLSGNWGPTHPWVQELFNKYGIDPNSVYYRDKEGPWINGEKIREGVDWGRKVDGVYKPAGDISPYPTLYDTPEQLNAEAKDYLLGLYGKAYESTGTPDLTPYGPKSVNWEEVDEKPLPSSNAKIHADMFLDADPSITIAGAPVGKDKNGNIYSDYAKFPAGTTENSPAYQEWLSSLKENNLPELNDGWHTPTFNDARQAIIEAYPSTKPLQGSLSSTASAKTGGTGNGSGDGDNPNGYNYDISDKTKWIIPALSALRFGMTANAQKRYLEQAKRMLNAGRFQELATWANLPTNDNPALDRQLQQVRLERMAGVKPVTSDLIANNALWNQREAQLYDRENDIISKRSAFDWDVKREALNIMNQNLANQITTHNSNLARQKAIDAAIEQQKLDFIERQNMSRQNMLMELSNNVMNDRKALLSYNQSVFADRQSRDYDAFLRKNFSDAATAYANLPYAQRAAYADLEDYIIRTVPGSEEEIAKYRRQMFMDQLEWQKTNALNYDYGWLSGKESTVGNKKFKKGGRVNGTTRYTKDPDEQIWIDNNKASHNQSAKLSDHTIKLLLRALK